MAISTTHTPAQAGFSFTAFTAPLIKGIKGFFGSLSRAMVINSTAQDRLNQVERLNQLSDAELAARGLKREDIVRHVFRDLFWN